MDRRILAVAAGVAVTMMAVVSAAHASQCTVACDQAYTTCDKAGTQNCLPKWGQCKQQCSAPATTPVKATQPPAKPKP